LILLKDTVENDAKVLITISVQNVKLFPLWNR